MMNKQTLYKTIDDLHDHLPAFHAALKTAPSKAYRGFVGFDGFVDTFIRMKQPDSMQELGPKITAAAGIAASYSVDHQGDKFGGNGPLFAAALSDLFSGDIEVSYIGGLGKDKVSPIFAEALEGKIKQIHSLAEPAHSDCLEFTDGKIMLGDFDACEEITLERMLEVMGEDEVDRLLQSADYVSAVNWGKLPSVGDIWSYLADRSATLNLPAKQVHLFMDLAEFEHRGEADVQGLIKRLPAITAQFTTLMSFNLKEAWQMGDRFGGSFTGKKDPEAVAELASLLRANLDVDKIIIHPNNGAACADDSGCIFVPGPYCQSPMISTGAGDNFGAGCLAASLLGCDNACMLLMGNSCSGYYVRSGKTPTFKDLGSFVDAWAAGNLPERL